MLSLKQSIAETSSLEMSELKTFSLSIFIFHIFSRLLPSFLFSILFDMVTQFRNDDTLAETFLLKIKLKIGL